MKSLNGNLLAAIDTETTGLAPGWNEITEIAIVPLGADYRPWAAFKPFSVEIKPAHPERFDTPHANHERLAHLLSNGREANEAFDLFEKWYADLKLAKKITPLGHNYSFDRGFLQAWMGAPCYELRFDYHCRDSHCAAAFLNDRAGDMPPFEYTNLKGLCEVLGVVNERAHNALADALACAECYRRMLIGHDIFG